MVRSLMRYLTYVGISLALLAVCVAPLMWFAWARLVDLHYQGSAGSIVILLLGALAAVLYVVALLTYPVGARFYSGHWPSRSVKAPEFKLRSRAMACVHFGIVTVLTFLPFAGSIKTGQEIRFWFVVVGMFVGMGMLHHAGLLLSWRLFPASTAGVAEAKPKPVPPPLRVP